ncbi:MAG: hypothetical protein K9N34_08350 [Candidatus Marinimicrobia bacterium]|nr:hypothetical protein [Candidatus Neomarinimicrobiota bacterium]MCF7840611.1 hypothetical protein [Candidatus Neomarinimicrobiota bacterium]MCF7902473.1 hypothetical protein [Candidatus Neomarinimicrobiota bacterium]
MKIILRYLALWLVLIALGFGQVSKDADEPVRGLMLQEGNLTLVTDSQDTTLLRDAAGRTTEIAREIESLTGLRLRDSLTIFFINNLERVRHFIPTAPTWSGGLTTDPNTLYVYDNNPVHWPTTLRHELTHVMVAQNDVTIPIWFNEGLAQYVAGNWSWNGYITLGNAVLRSDVIPLTDLGMVLTYSRKKAELGYAEALSAFKYMLERQGKTILPLLLVASDMTFNERYEMAARETILDFEIGWRQHLERSYAFFRLAKFPDVLWLLMPFLVLAGWLLMRYRNKKKLKQWELEEAFQERQGMLD